jgi:ABC-type branched-subunit amino acid transport system substrate-binding protein
VLARSQIQEVFPLAACSRLAENSRLGFAPVASTSQWGFSFSISSSTLGLSASLYDGRVRPRSTRKDREFEAFQWRYRQQYDELPDDYASYAYDGINLLIAAIEKAGPDRHRVNDALHVYQSLISLKVTGPMLFRNLLSYSKDIMIARVEGGRFVYWTPTQPKLRVD